MIDLDVEEALRIAELIGNKLQNLMKEEEDVDVEILSISLVWAAIGVAVASGEIEEESLKLGLHYAIDSALENLPRQNISSETIH
jgi:hypothetical protein